MRHSTRDILFDVSFDVAAGEVVALFGPSGAGKSTTLLALAGLLDGAFRVLGSVTLDGHEISSFPAEARSLAGMSIVLQGLGLFPDRTVLANVEYPLRRRGLGRREADRRARAILRQFHLEGLEFRRPGSLSGGQQQRVGLARAMVYAPSILLLDEPFKGLDLELRAELLLEVRRLARAGTSVILVTHERREIQLAADKLVQLRAGRVNECELASANDGLPAEFRSLPHSVGGCQLPEVDAGGHGGPSDLSRCKDTEQSPFRVVERRSLDAAAVALLIEAEDGSLRWLEVEPIVARTLGVGTMVAPALLQEQRIGGTHHA